MSNTEILERAIKKAIDGGWDFYTQHNQPLRVQIFNDNLEHYLFSHDFAKALWGDNNLSYVPGRPKPASPNLGWQHHLQQMVISDDPITYLGANI